MFVCMFYIGSKADTAADTDTGGDTDTDTDAEGGACTHAMCVRQKIVY